MATLLGTSYFNGRNGNQFQSELYFDYSQNIGANQTTLTYYLYFVSINGYSGSGATVNAYINGNWVGNTTSISAREHKYMGSFSQTIQHNADGTFPNTGFSSLIDTPWTLGDSSIGGTLTSGNIPTIPRKTDAPTWSSGFIDVATTIILNPKSDSFTHTLRYDFGSLTNQIIATGIRNSCTWTIPTSFYEQIGSTSTSGVGTLYVDTYNGGTWIGTSSKTFTAYTSEDKCKPTPTISVIDINEDTLSLTGSDAIIILNASTAQVNITPNVKNGATIREIKINGESNGTSTTKTFTKTTINSYYVTVTDSRGYVSSVVYSTGNTYKNYVAPSINVGSSKITRENATNNIVDIVLKGNYFDGNFGATNNTLTMYYRYETNGSYSNWSTLSGYTTSGTTFTSSVNKIPNINVNYAYNFQFYLVDKINTSNIITIACPKYIPVVYIGPDTLNVNGTINQTSLESQKKNFLELGSVLSILKNSKIWEYNLIGEKDGSKKHYGFVIPTKENSKFEVPNLVLNSKGNAIDIYSMIAILWRIVQEQQEIIDNNTNMIDEIKEKLENE